MSVTSRASEFPGVGQSILDILAILPETEKLGRPDGGSSSFCFLYLDLNNRAFLDGIDFLQRLEDPILEFDSDRLRICITSRAIENEILPWL